MADAMALLASQRFLEEPQNNLLHFIESGPPLREPNIQVWSVILRGDRSLTLRHFQHNERPLNDGGQEVLKHVARLWGFGVQLESINAKGDTTQRWSVPAPVTD